jgi:hypothetical protein
LRLGGRAKENMRDRGAGPWAGFGGFQDAVSIALRRTLNGASYKSTRLDADRPELTFFFRDDLVMFVVAPCHGGSSRAVS